MERASFAVAGVAFGERHAEIDIKVNLGIFHFLLILGVYFIVW